MTDKMKKYRLFPAICLAAALLLSACSQDELGENSTALPEGEYPLQIGSVTLTAEVSEQPWTRVAESTDGMSSEFKAGDAIGVSLNGETATYTTTARHGLPKLPSIGRTRTMLPSLLGILWMKR